MKRLLLSPFRYKKSKNKDELPPQQDNLPSATNNVDATWGNSPCSTNNYSDYACPGSSSETDWGGVSVVSSSGKKIRPRSKSVSSFQQVQDVNRHINTTLVPFLASSNSSINKSQNEVK
jgi:hypothetical protein